MNLPEWFNGYRDNQFSVVAEIVTKLKDNDLVILDAPTGSGKTLIAESVRQIGKFAKTAYICNSKTLQAQFIRDFDYASLLMGRNNYVVNEENDATAADCTWTKDDPNCWWCGRKWTCPYEQAKAGALSNDLAVLNTSYFLTEANGPGRFSGRDFVIVDEADTLENELMGYVGFQISAKRVESLKLGEPEKVTKEESWVSWAEQAVERVNAHVGEWPPEYDRKDLVETRRRTAMQNLQANLFVLRSGLAEGGWVYTGKDGQVSFKPVKVDSVGKRMLWGHSKKWLLMSATVISPHEMVESLGYVGTWDYVEMGSTFPVENRQVKVMPLADMSRKVDEKSEAAKVINSILDRHPSDRVLIHSVSYDLARYIADSIDGRTVVTYTKSADREGALKRFKKSPNTVLIACSMERGVDLPDDLCRVVIVAKVPFPYLGDRQISARLYGTRGGQQWYDIQTIRSIVQMCGRATRHKDDFSTSYIIDKQWNRLWKNSGLFPPWFRNALDFKDRVRV